MTGQAALADPQMVTFPGSLPPNLYYVLAQVDPTNRIDEVSETNNIGSSAIALSNAFDFAMTSASVSPTTVEVGTVMTVQATAQSLGLSFTGNVPFAVFLSPDDMFDPGDQPVYEGQVFFAGTTSTPLDITFPLNPLPGDPQLTPGGFQAFVVIDPAKLFAESVETNNADLANSVTIQGADLFVVSLTGPAVGFIGIPYEVTLTLENDDIVDARGFQYAYYLSDNPIIRTTDTQVFVSATATVASGEQMTFVDSITFPPFNSEQSLYLGVVVDIFSRVPESNEPNNIGRLPTPGVETPISIVFPIPDLSAEIVSSATVAAAGEQLAITRILTNRGVAPATGFEYTYYLSANPVITTDDTSMGTFTMTLPAGADDYGIDLVQVPLGVRGSNYYLGVIVDPRGVITEVDEDNNASVGPQIPFYPAAIQFLTDDLPVGVIGVPYEVGVYAAGGPLPISWSVPRGALPEGLTLDAANGIISGTPSTEGRYEFTLRASSGTAYAEQDFSIHVTSPTVDLTVATPALQTAIIGMEYRTTLVGVGGQVPYEWSTISQGLGGLTLSPDGVLSGTPDTPGAFSITFRLRDALGDVVTKELILNVINANQAIHIPQIPLPKAVVGLPYCGRQDIQLEVSNGIEPYRWSIVGTAPAGMTLSEDGIFCGTPEEVGLFPLTVRVQDATGLFDTSVFLFEVESGTELTITTFSLEQATADEAYEASVTAMRGSEPYLFGVVDAIGALPSGLTFSESGVISGTPTEEGVFAFVVQVTDSAGRTDIQPLSIEVLAAPAPEIDDGGCGCTASRSEESSDGVSLAAVLGLAGLLALRRRRGRTLLAGAVLALVLTGSSVAHAQEYVVITRPGSLAPIDSIPGIGPVTEIFSNFSSTLDRNNTIGFDFVYDNVTYTGFGVSAEGWVGLEPLGTSSSNPNNVASDVNTDFGVVFAPFWDNLSSNTVRTAMLGAAPDRARVIEFDAWQAGSGGSSSDSGRMQVWILERGAVEFHYSGTITTGYSATMGVTGPLGSPQAPLLPCGLTADCDSSDYASAVGTVFVLDPDPGVELTTVSIEAPEIAFLGSEIEVGVEVRNRHGATIGPFTVAVVASHDRDLSNAVTIGSLRISLADYQTETISITATPPPSLGEGLIWFGGVVDSEMEIAEFDETNNTVVAEATTRLLGAKPDLAIQTVHTDRSSVSAGQEVTVFAQVRNVGGEPANDVTVGVMLSTNPLVSPQDVQLGTFSLSLAPGETATTTTSVFIPNEINSGEYYFGAFADLENTAVEVDESNNGLAAFRPLTVDGGALAIVTDRLPSAMIRVPYSAALRGTGGQQSGYVWSISEGRLPDGLGLVGSGELYGRANIAECQNFTVELTDGNQTVSQPLMLCVSDPEEPLTIISRAVPDALVGQEYAFTLFATGHTESSSLAWSAQGLPEGLAVSGDGILMGTATEAGTSTATFTVMAGSEVATRDIRIDVYESAKMLIVPSVLSTARFGEDYSEQLTATGGLEPITWILQIGELPEGLTLSPSGLIFGAPMEAGRFRVSVEARDAGSGAAAARDVASFDLEVIDERGEFVIATESLPDGFVDQGYVATITAMNGLAPYEWSVVEGRLPEGLLASVSQETGEFRIAGQPSATGVSSLLIAVTDSQGLTARRAFALRVLEPPVIEPSDEDEGGCTCTSETRSGNAAWPLLGLLAGLFFVRRRR